MQQSDVHGEPILNIVGERVALGPVRRDLLPTYNRWYNDFEMRRTFGGYRPWTMEHQARWYEAISTPSLDEFMFTIYTVDESLPIGTTSMTGVDYRNRSAEFGILIGEPTLRGKGYGTEATRLMLDFAFTVVGLHSVWLSVYEYNLAGIHSYHNVGFREIGRRRQSYWMGGRLWDTVLMDILASEFSSPVLSKIFVPDEIRS